jgi:LuxR family maltose regulon positive regulatory protein
MAEYYYQQDKCYDAISSLESVMNEIQHKGSPAVLQAALYVRMRIMIAKNQVSQLQPLIDDFETKIQKVNYSLYPGYIDSLRIWFALYEGDNERAANWLAAEAPKDNDTFTIMDLFSAIVKLRVYLQFGKYYILASAVERLIPILENWHREMDLCEVYLIHAMGLFSDNNFEKAYIILDTALPVIKRRKYYRLAADEGEKMYHMLRAYKKERNLSDECLDRLIVMSKETGLVYPNYLKKLSEKYPSLTDAEKSVLKLMSDERSNMEIAEYLNISINTVKFHNKNIFMKLNVNNRHQAIRAAQEADII